MEQQSKLTRRNFQIEEDYWRIRNFLREIFLLTGRIEEESQMTVQVLGKEGLYPEHLEIECRDTEGHVVDVDPDGRGDPAGARS